MGIISNSYIRKTNFSRYSKINGFQVRIIQEWRLACGGEKIMEYKDFDTVQMGESFSVFEALKLKPMTVKELADYTSLHKGHISYALRTMVQNDKVFMKRIGKTCYYGLIKELRG